MTAPLSRREFLKAAGWTAGGVTILSGCSLIPVLPSFDGPSAGSELSWVQLWRDGRVRFFCPRAEMGQGIATGLSQVVAEELGLELGDIDCRYPRTDEIQKVAMTVASQSIEEYFEPTARAAATLRTELERRAARRLGVAPSALLLERGRFSAAGARVAFAELLSADEDALLPAAEQGRVPLLSQRAASQRRVVGRDAPLVHAERLLSGREVYSRDVRLPEMAFGAVARPPQIGAALEGFDADAARGVAGVIAVVEGPANAVGVVAETPMAATEGIAALACRWRALTPEEVAEVDRAVDVDALSVSGDLDHTPEDEGSLSVGRERATAEIDVRYDTPLTAHASMEPRSGVARVTEEGCEVWTGSQDPWFVQGHVARALGLDVERVVVHNHRIGGAFGGRLLCQASVEAAWLARGAGRPVKVQWTREEETAWNYAGPGFSHRIQAGVDADGEIAYWHHRMAGGPILISSALIPDHLHWAGDLAPDPGTRRGTDLPYRVANRRVDFADVRAPMPTGAWRGLGAAPNTFAVECALDELISAGDLDPFSFRQRHALDPRLASVLERLRAFAGWDAAQERGATLGMAAAAYKHVTFVAVAAQVSVADGAPRVEKLWCVHDCGTVIAPDRVRAQIEGNLVWGVGMAFREALVLEAGRVATTNFDGYRVARMSDVPPMEIELVSTDAAPSGAGEAAFAPAAAAIVNALARAERRRSRRLPWRASA